VHFEYYSYIACLRLVLPPIKTQSNGLKYTPGIKLKFKYMKLKFQTQGFTASEELTKLLYQKLAKLAQFFDRILVVEVKMRIDNSNIGESKMCNIRLVIPGNDLLANAQSKTFEEAIADAVEALKKQIEKRKTKLDVSKKTGNRLV